MNKPSLSEAIRAITESYRSPLPINNLESAALPNRRQIIEAYGHIARTIYLGFYSERPLTAENLEAAVAEHVQPAYTILKEQIGRAVRYAQRFWGHCVRSGDFSDEVALGLISAIPELRSRLSEDAQTAFDSDLAARSFEEVVFSYPTLQAITAYRVAHYLYQQSVPMIPRILSEHAHSSTGIDIHPGATIGRRFFIDHGTGVVIGETAEIGDDVKLYQGVTLGALSSGRPQDLSTDECRRKRHPTIESRVTIYAGATILGGETKVGQDSVIGGNVWLVRSVPPGSKIFGKAREETPESES